MMTYAIILQDKEDILHYGTPRHSGRYPYGSGARPFQGKSKSTTVLKTKKDITAKAKVIMDEVDKYQNGGPAGNQNCQLCTWSMEAQFRGMNVLPRPVYSPRDVVLEKTGYDIIKNPEKLKISDKNDVIDKISSAGEGSRFYTHVNWKDSSGGHEFITANVEGSIYVIDAQSGIVDKIDTKNVKDYFDDINYDNSYLVRMDNKDFNPDILKYNDRSYLTEWDDKKDIEYMRKHNMLSDSDEKSLKHSQGGFEVSELYTTILLSPMSDIQHFGIKRKSGRYPWGSGKRPYQSSPSPPRNETSEQREARKQKVLRSAQSATEIAEFAPELTNTELRTALDRIDLNKKLSQYVKAEKEAGIKKVDEAMKKVGQINNWTKTGVDSIKNVDAIINLINSIKIAAKGGNYEEYKKYLQEQERKRRQQQSGQR